MHANYVRVRGDTRLGDNQVELTGAWCVQSIFIRSFPHSLHVPSLPQARPFTVLTRPTNDFVSIVSDIHPCNHKHYPVPFILMDPKRGRRPLINVLRSVPALID